MSHVAETGFCSLERVVDDAEGNRGQQCFGFSLVVDFFEFLLPQTAEKTLHHAIDDISAVDPSLEFVRSILPHGGQHERLDQLVQLKFGSLIAHFDAGQMTGDVLSHTLLIVGGGYDLRGGRL